MTETPAILDATCGGRSIWLDEHKQNGDAVYVDRRQEESGFHGQEGRTYGVQPDMLADNRRLPFADSSFDLAVFDPPYVTRDGGMDQLAGVVIKKYGALRAQSWQSDLHDAVCELFRVLTSAGTLVFKFADVQTEWTDVLDVLPVSPLCGTTTKKTSNQETRWFVLHSSQYQEGTDD
jgi:ubiquinone/menaquinone biosynthesis C-methylase UbiE